MSELSFARPSPTDFLAVDSLLDEEELMLRDTVRQFVSERILDDIGSGSLRSRHVKLSAAE